MTNDATGRGPKFTGIDEATVPWCPACRSADYLLLESVTGAADRSRPVMDVEYTCMECDAFYAHPVTVDDLTRFTEEAQALTGPGGAEEAGSGQAMGGCI